jgi:hypothetical protein
VVAGWPLHDRETTEPEEKLMEQHMSTREQPDAQRMRREGPPLGDAEVRAYLAKAQCAPPRNNAVGASVVGTVVFGAAAIFGFSAAFLGAAAGITVYALGKDRESRPDDSASGAK